MDLDKWYERLTKFAKDRDWEKFHTPKNLVMALSGEVGELNELFQWLDEPDSMNKIKDESFKKNLEREIADIQVYLWRLCQVCQVDLEQSLQAKMKENEFKYPANKVFGKNLKYTEYSEN